MKKLVILATVVALFASCKSENKTNSGLLGGDSAVITIDSTAVDSLLTELTLQDTFITDSVN